MAFATSLQMLLFLLPKCHQRLLTFHCNTLLYQQCTVIVEKSTDNVFSLHLYIKLIFFFSLVHIFQKQIHFLVTKFKDFSCFLCLSKTLHINSSLICDACFSFYLTPNSKLFCFPKLPINMSQNEIFGFCFKSFSSLLCPSVNSITFSFFLLHFLLQLPSCHISSPPCPISGSLPQLKSLLPNPVTFIRRYSFYYFQSALILIQPEDRKEIHPVKHNFDHLISA